MNWSSAGTECNTTKNTSTPVIGATWLLASEDQWNYMRGTNGAGGDTALCTGFTSVGGTNMQSSYWSSKEVNDALARSYSFYECNWFTNSKGQSLYVRACLAF